jgi:hypothetical protein
MNDPLKNLLCEINSMIETGIIKVGALGLSQDSADFCRTFYDDPMKDACDCDGEEWHQREASCPTKQEHEPKHKHGHWDRNRCAYVCCKDCACGMGSGSPPSDVLTPPKETWQERFDETFGCAGKRDEAVGAHSNYSYQTFLSFITSLLDEAYQRGVYYGHYGAMPTWKPPTK